MEDNASTTATTLDRSTATLTTLTTTAASDENFFAGEDPDLRFTSAVSEIGIF